MRLEHGRHPAAHGEPRGEPGLGAVRVHEVRADAAGRAGPAVATSPREPGPGDAAGVPGYASAPARRPPSAQFAAGRTGDHDPQCRPRSWARTRSVTTRATPPSTGWVDVQHASAGSCAVALHARVPRHGVALERPAGGRGASGESRCRRERVSASRRPGRKARRPGAVVRGAKRKVEPVAAGPQRGVEVEDVGVVARACSCTRAPVPARVRRVADRRIQHVVRGLAPSARDGRPAAVAGTA